MVKPGNHICYIGLGTNQGNRSANLDGACGLIELNCGKILKRSSIYASLPWGYSSKNEYYNQCIEISTSFKPDLLIGEILQIEERMGRKRASGQVGYADRVIDIDILFYDDRVLKMENLEIPHPRIHQRSFVLRPLAEIAGEFQHPVSGKTIGELDGDSYDVEVRLILPPSTP